MRGVIATLFVLATGAAGAAQTLRQQAPAGESLLAQSSYTTTTSTSPTVCSATSVTVLVKGCHTSSSYTAIDNWAKNTLASESFFKNDAAISRSFFFSYADTTTYASTCAARTSYLGSTKFLQSNPPASSQHTIEIYKSTNNYWYLKVYNDDATVATFKKSSLSDLLSDCKATDIMTNIYCAQGHQPYTVTDNNAKRQCLCCTSSTQCTCPATKVFNAAGECICPNTQELVGSTCKPVCTGGKTRGTDGECACATTEDDVSGTCKPVCTGGKSRGTDGECACSSTEDDVSGTCKPICTGGKTRGTDGECACATTEDDVAGTCKPVCTGGKSRGTDGECACATTEDDVAGTCKPVCTGGKTRGTDGECACASTEDDVSGTCKPVCTGGKTRGTDGECACTASEDDVSGICMAKCVGGKTRSGVTCVCSLLEDDVNDVCMTKCTGGKTRGTDSVCVCASTEDDVSGTCKPVCTGGKTRGTDGECACSSTEDDVSGTCKAVCTGGKTRGTDGECACSLTEDDVAGTCKPVCTGGKSRGTDGECACASTEDDVAGTCKSVCTGGKTRGTDGECACAATEDDVAGTCKPICTGGKTRGTDGECACATTEDDVAGTCKPVCTGGKTRGTDGECACATTEDDVSGTCKPVCTGGKSRGTDGECACSSTEDDVSGTCKPICTGGKTRGTDGECACATTEDDVAGTCKPVCTGGKSRGTDGECACATTEDDVAGTCKPVCTGGKTRGTDGECACASTEDDVSGTCKPVCTGGKARGTDGECTCPETDDDVDGTCLAKCAKGASRNSLNACVCPKNQEVVSGECTKVCHWKADKSGYTCQWSDATKTSLTLAGDCAVNAPVPKDNYVNDNRNNNDEPDIELTASQGAVQTSAYTASWLSYATSPNSVADEITFTTFGVYELGMTATDYRQSFTCDGCIAIVDNFPPTAIQKCQTTVETSSPDFTADVLADAIAKEEAFTSFYADSNVANNGAYDGATGANDRCDDKTAEMQDFFESAASSLATIDTKCFESDFVEKLLDNTPTDNLFSKSETELNALQCKRCCSKSRVLKEHYYDYQCGTDFAYTEQKTVTSDSCTFGYCISVPSATLVTASAGITADADAKTTTVIDGLPTPVTPDDHTIHRSITCTSFNGGCTFTPKLGDLFALSSAWGSAGGSLPASYKASDYVFWRYSLNTEDWETWSDDVLLTFKDAQTTVFVEAWTHCGLVYSDSFTVVLHPHTLHDACANFATMWAEKSPTLRTVESHICAYPGSDFVAMTFAYDSATDTAHDANTVKGKYTDVACFVTLAESGLLNTVAEVEIPLSVVPDSAGRIQVSKQLALELVHDLSTAKNTDVKVRCDFTFSYFDSTATANEPCSHTFTITDCDRPDIDPYNSEEVCKAGECMDPSGAPGAFEACDGSVLTTETGDKTVIKSVTGECCDECTTTLECVALPEADEVKRCQPAAPTTLIAMVMSAVGAPEGSETGVVAVSLVGATALVAAMALVVVKVRQSAAAAHAKFENDAYYPLLE